MNPPIQPRLTEKGVAFTVVVDAVKRECLITQQALHTLSASKRGASSDDIMEIFRAFEANINGIARRLVGAGVAGAPLVIRPETFNSPRTH